jgi:hypothetical protein
MRNVQESMEDSAKQLREYGRKAFLAYLGAWGMGYDFGKSVYSDGWKFVDKAEKRGEEVEKELKKFIEAYQKDFPGEVKKLANTVEDGVKHLAEDVSEQAGKYGEDIQKRMAARFDFMHREAKLESIEVSEKATDAVNKAAEAVKDTAEAVAESVENAFDAVWKGYDDLSVKDITAGLDKFDVETLEKVRVYEAANKNRVTVLREIDAKLQAVTA